MPVLVLASAASLDQEEAPVFYQDKSSPTLLPPPTPWATESQEQKGVSVLSPFSRIAHRMG